MTYSKITLNSLLCMMAFYSQCHGSNDPFSSDISESQSPSNLSTLMHVSKPHRKEDRQSYDLQRESLSDFSQIGTITSPANTIESDDFFVDDRSSSSIPIFTTIPSGTDVNESKLFGESRRRSSSCFPRIRTSPRPVDSPTSQADIGSFSDQAPTVTPKEESSSTVELPLPPSVTTNRNSVRITPKAMEEFLEKRRSIKMVHGMPRKASEPLDRHDETSSSQFQSTRSSMVNSQEDIDNHPARRSSFSSLQHSLSYPTQYMPIPPYPSQFLPPYTSQYVPQYSTQYMPMTPYPAQFLPPYTSQYVPIPPTPRCSQSSNGLPMKYGGNSPDQSAGVLSQPLLSETMNPFELMDGCQNSQNNNGSSMISGENSSGQSSGVLSQSLLSGTLPLRSSRSSIFKPLDTRNSTVTPTNHTEYLSEENELQDELLATTQQQPHYSRTTSISLRQTMPISPINSQCDLSQENHVASSRHGIESSPKSPSTHIYANSSPEFGDHNGNNIIKWPRAHIYANSSPEFGDHNGSNTIFCDPPRVGEGEDFDTIDPLTVTHKELTRTHSTNNKRFADERVGGGSLLKESTVKLETVVGLQSTNCSSDNNSLYSKNHDNYKVVLSVDGGGVRGIMPAMILKNVHDKLGENFKFDLMGGTSVGALVVTAFALGKIDRFINDYNAVAKKIFTRNWSRCNPLNWFSITRGLLGTSYRSDSKEQAIRDFVEQKEEDAYSFDAIKTRMMFPFYLQQNGTVAYYRNFDEISNPNKHKYSLINSLMSTTAAPTFFNPHVFNGLDGCRYEGIDGGVFANNPAFVSYNEARQLFSKSRIILLSLGTGDHHYMDPNLASTDRGNLFWAKKYPTITNAAMASHTHESLTQKAIDGKLDYYRINPHLLPHLCNSMDDTSPTYISTLKAYVNRAIAHSKDLHNFVEKVREVKNIES